MKFQKFDGKKNRLELIEPEFIEGLGRILSFGADKYEAHNWKKASSPEDQDRIYGALQRHLLAYKKGEKLDPETGESHLYHACCNLMFLDYQDRMGEKETVLKCAGDVSYPKANRYLPHNLIRQSQKIEDALLGQDVYSFMGYGRDGGNKDKLLIYMNGKPQYAFNTYEEFVSIIVGKFRGSF